LIFSTVDQAGWSGETIEAKVATQGESARLRGTRCGCKNGFEKSASSIVEFTKDNFATT
jgi:hypothetical protein